MRTLIVGLFVLLVSTLPRGAAAQESDSTQLAILEKAFSTGDVSALAAMASERMDITMFG